MGHNNNEVKKGKIYKIIALTDNYDLNDVYFGSTIMKLSKRFDNHKCDYRKNRNKSSSILFEKYGLDNCKIVLIEEIDFTNIEELRKKEVEYILNNKCVNKSKPFVDKEEQKEKRKDYFNNRKEEKKDYDKKYRELNKEKLNKGHICECGGLYQTHHKLTHFKTKKHTDYIKTK